MVRGVILGTATLIIRLYMGETDLWAAERPSLLELLKALNLSSYPSPMRPPEFSGFTTNSRKISLSEQRGRVVLVNFWATWCLECRPEMAVFERLHREFSPHGFIVIGINARETTSKIQQYAKELGLTFPLIADRAGKD